jgi:hypothetical protein
LAGVIEAQQQKIKNLQEQLAEFNQAKYKMFPANASRGKNVIRTSKKVSMTVTDQINQQIVGSYLREAVWPSTKMLPKKWSQWREERNSLCQMIRVRLLFLLGWIRGHTGNQCYLESPTTNSALCEQILNKSCLSSFKVSAFACPVKLLNSLTPDIQQNSILHIDDKDIGWSPISDDNGRIFVNARGWTSRDIQENELPYEQAEDFLNFLDKYVSRAMGTHFVLRWNKSIILKQPLLDYRIGHCLQNFSLQKLKGGVGRRIRDQGKRDA